MSFFDIMVHFRASQELLNQMEKLKDKDPEKFESFSHIIRIAIIRLIREEGIK